MKSVSAVIGLVLVVAAVGCEKRTTTAPSSAATAPAATATVTDAATGITLTAAVPASPANNAQIRFSDQPVRLVANNAVTTGSTPLSYAFEVASDAAFTAIVSTKPGADAGGQQIAATLDKLAGAKTYYWRVRVTSGTVAGPASAVRAFQIGPEVVLQAPVLAFPANNGTLTGTPLLTANNVARSGPVGTISYRFDVSDSSAFSRIVFTGTTAEASGGQTSIQMNASTLTSGATYYWRVQASDSPSGVTSPQSAVFSFQYVAFDMRNATIVDSPYDLGSWAETAKITRVDFSQGYVVVDFDRRDGPNRWPDTPWGAPGDSVEYCLGMCLNVDNHWYCSAPIQFWYGRELEAGGRADEVGINWFYPPAWGAMSGHQPAFGETVGIFVAEGNTRHNTVGDESIVHERSNVLLLPFGTNFSGGSSTSSVVRRPQN